MYNSMEIAEKIKATAKEQGITIKNMLSDTALGVNTLQHMKTSMPKTDTLAVIADYLGVSVDYLLGRKFEEASVDNKKSAPDDDIRDTIIEKLNNMDDRQLARLQGYLEGLAASEKE